ncbi:glycosyltransferase family 4 protein, partial [Barnesiella intestinihominis]
YRFIVRHLNSLDRIIANSDYVREMLTGNGVKRDRIERIHNGIHIADYTVTEQERLDAREAVRKEFSLSADCRIITYVGRLSPEKGVEVLVDAFRTLCISTENVACLLVGDGVQREELQARINSYPCKEKIIFAGFRRDIKHLLAGSDVFVLPSHIETFSLSILQAFAAGTPCVASDVGGTPEQILPRLNGLLFQDNDSTELASRLNEILNDEEFRCYLTHNAIVLSHSYLNDNRMIGDIENLYGRLISK